MKPATFEDVLAGTRRSAIIEGDCLDKLRTLPASSISSVVTDPPYGLKYQGLENNRPKILNDENPFVWWLYDAHRALMSPGALICFCPWKFQEEFRTSIRIAGFSVRSQVIWDRMQPGMGNTACTFGPRHDVIWFAAKGRFTFPAGRPQSVIQAHNVPAKRRVHSTEKPLDLMTKLIRSVTPAGGIVLDPCCGSGSTGVAAVAAGFPFIGIELDPANAETARRRLHEAETRKAKFAKPSIHGMRARPRWVA